MKRRFYFLLMALSILVGSVFQVKAQTAPTPPTISTEGNEVWYFIQCLPRSANLNAKWLTGGVDGTIITNQEISATDAAQQWKVVANGDGIALVNKVGTYMNSDVPGYTTDLNAVVLNCVTSAPLVSLKLWPYVDQTAKPGGFYLVDYNATTPITNAANTSVTFQFYSAGSGAGFRPINYGVAAPNINSAIKFMTAKDILLEAITSATTGYNNSSEGLNPGQFTQDDRDALFGSIEAAQAIFDNPATTTTGYFDAANELNSIFTQFRAQVILPEVSSENSEVWYYIQGTRPANTYLTGGAAGAATQVKDLPVIPDSTQLWKLVANGDGFALKNKASGEFIQTDFGTGTNLSTQADLPTNALRFITSKETFNKAYRFWIENTASSTPALRFHAGGVNNGWGLMNWTGNADDNCTWLFLSEDEVFRAELTNTKATAQAFISTLVQGNEFGQYSADVYNAFNTVLTAELAKDMATMNQEQLKASNQAIKDAMNAVVCNQEVATLSTLTQKKWFRLINNMTGTGYASNKAMSSNGRTVDQKFTYETKDVASDAQLFSFEMNEAGTAATAIVNKSTGMYMGADGKISATAPAIEFAIVSLDNVSFKIVPTGMSPLHAAAVNVEILNWESGAGSASAWRFEYVSSEDISDFKPAYVAKRKQAREKITAATPAIGTEFGQYTAASIASLETVVAAEEAKDTLTMTQEQMKQGILDINAALSVGFVVNTDLKLLKSTNPTMYKWFRIVSYQSGEGYASGKAISSNGRTVGQSFTYETVNTESDAQLFRFILSADETQVAEIISKDNAYVMSATGMVDTLSTTNNSFEITQLDGGRGFWIDPTLEDVDPLHAQYTGAHIVNWMSGAGSASAWLIEFVKEDPNAVKTVSAQKYNVRTMNNMITVDGVENFEVYSIVGQKQNIHSKLNAGVYVVKVNNFIQKVVLK